MKLPEYVEKLFLDLGGATPDIQRHSQQIIERIMKLGNWKAIRWMFKTYGEETIRAAAVKTRELTIVDINFWSIVLSIPKKDFPWISRF